MFSTHPELLLFYDKYKALIVVRIQISHLDAGLLLLPYSLAATVQQLQLDIWI